MTKIAIFVGSLRQESFNKKLAVNLEKSAPEGTEFHYVDIDLPLFNEDLETDFPASAQTVKDIVEAADGVLFVTPEYNRSIPGVLKNAIDWTSRPWGSNSFNGKPAGIVGASPSPVGTAVAQAELRNIAVYLNMKVLGQPEVYLAGVHAQLNEDGVIIDASQSALTEYMTTFINWVNTQK